MPNIISEDFGNTHTTDAQKAESSVYFAKLYRSSERQPLVFAALCENKYSVPVVQLSKSSAFWKALNAHYPFYKMGSRKNFFLYATSSTYR